MITQKGTIVYTFDDIIVENTYNLYLYLLTNYTTYGKYLNIYNINNKEYIYNRNNKDLIIYLFKKELLSNKYINNMFNNLYLNLLNKYYSKDIYTSLQPSKIAKSTLLNPLFLENQGIESIYIIVKYKIEEEKIYKEKYIKNTFKNSKIHILFLKDDVEYIKAFEHIVKWNLVITDDIKLIEDLAKGDIDHKEFLLLKCGYNEIPSRLKYLIREKNANINQYNN